MMKLRLFYTTSSVLLDNALMLEDNGTTKRSFYVLSTLFIVGYLRTPCVLTVRYVVGRPFCNSLAKVIGRFVRAFTTTSSILYSMVALTTEVTSLL